MAQPVHGYNGFMRNDTAQLEATINVLRTFVDAGVDVWLRFAVSVAQPACGRGVAHTDARSFQHEFNWYTRRGALPPAVALSSLA